METTIRTDLLRQLADHLLNGKLGHNIFSFTTFNNTEQNICGTVGCAAGECPIVWPDKWRFAKKRSVRLMDSEDDNLANSQNETWADLCKFFNIIPIMSYHLFCPSEWDNEIDEWVSSDINQQTELFGGEILGNDATKQEVAQNILAFCDLADAGKIQNQ